MGKNFKVKASDQGKNFLKLLFFTAGVKNRCSDIAKKHQSRDQDHNSNPGPAPNSMYDVR